MRVEQKTFYADLFSKSADAAGKAPPPPPKILVALHDEPPGPKPDAPPLRALPAPVREPDPEPDPEPAPKPATEPTPKPAAEPAAAAAQVRPKSPLAELIGNVDIHRLTPRQMADLSLDLYAAGAVSYDDYAELAFQPELDPHYDRTIGALTGERADPDRPRDFVKLWEERAEFQRRHNGRRHDLIEQSQRIASVLRQIDSPTNVVV